MRTGGFLRLFVLLVAGCAYLAVASAQQDGQVPKPAPAVQALLDQADKLTDAQRYEEALAQLVECQETAKKLNDVIGRAIALRTAAAIQEHLHRNEEALKSLQDCVGLFASVGDRPSQIEALTETGKVQAALNHVDQAMDAYNTALGLQEKAGDAEGAGQTHVSIAVLLQEKDPKASLEHATKAKSVFETAKNAQWEAVSLILMGSVGADLGHHEEAVQNLGAAAKLCQSNELAWLEGEALRKLGQEFEDVGLFSVAIGYYSRSLEIAQGLKDSQGEGSRLLSLGVVTDKIGQHKIAQGYFKRAMEIQKGLGNKGLYASAMQNLGEALHEAGDTEEGRKRIEEAYDLQKELGNQVAAARCLGALGNIDTEAKDFEKAKGRLAQAAAIFHDQRDALDEATAYDSLGSVHFEEGSFDQALVNYDKAIAIYEGLHADTYAATSYRNKAEALYRLKRLQESDKFYQAAVQRFELVRTGLGDLTDAKSSYLGKRVQTYQQYANVLTLLGKPDEAFDIVQKMKGRGLLDLIAAGNVSVDAGMSAEDRETERALRAKADALSARMIQEGVENQVGAKARYAGLATELKEAEDALSQFMTSVYSRVPGLSAKRMADTVTTAECGKALPDDTALVEYVVSDYAVVSLVLRKVNGVITINGHSREIDLSELERCCADLRKSCGNPKGDFAAQAANLYGHLIGPLAKDIAGKQRLIICPDGCLWDVPFGVLMANESKFLVDDYEIDYAYSATSARSSLANQLSARKPTKDLLICANPDFGQNNRFQALSQASQRPIDSVSRPIDQPSRPIDQPSRPIDQPSRPIDQPSRPIDQPSRPIDQPSRALDSVSRAIDSLSRFLTEDDRGVGTIRPLPGTQVEADRLKALTPSATVLTGAAAQESTIKSVAREYRYIHLASHGFVNDASPLLSNVVLAQPSKGSPDDGFLTAREIYGLNLQADMVVLSACNTARGEIRSGEGIVGLTWALFVAGCPCQVVSQWSVDDTSTADLMADFYGNLLTQHEPKGKALRAAAMKVRKNPKYSHPFYWAPFVLVGDWH